ncbi:MAG: hypothetical protein QXI33_01145 [Candidatus Pacearchaeota archaeon]
MVYVNKLCESRINKARELVEFVCDNYYEKIFELDYLETLADAISFLENTDIGENYIDDLEESLSYIGSVLNCLDNVIYDLWRNRRKNSGLERTNYIQIQNMYDNLLTAKHYIVSAIKPSEEPVKENTKRNRKPNLVVLS